MDENTKARVRELAINLAASASLNIQFVYNATLHAVDAELDLIFRPEPNPVQSDESVYPEH
jgi:hypothetical protein